jgi:hypothetical protein
MIPTPATAQPLESFRQGNVYSIGRKVHPLYKSCQVKNIIGRSLGVTPLDTVLSRYRVRKDKGGAFAKDRRI